jgi:hypothetical protein
MKVRPVGRATPCAPAVDVQAAARRGLTRPTTTRVACPQRQRRDMFVESGSHTTKPRQGRHSASAQPLMPHLRSWNQIGSIFYKYVAPLVLLKPNRA